MSAEYYLQDLCEGIGDQHSENNHISHHSGLGAHFQSITTSQMSSGNL